MTVFKFYVLCIMKYAKNRLVKSLASFKITLQILELLYQYASLTIKSWIKIDPMI